MQLMNQNPLVDIIIFFLECTFKFNLLSWSILQNPKTQITIGLQTPSIKKI